MFSFCLNFLSIIIFKTEFYFWWPLSLMTVLMKSSFFVQAQKRKSEGTPDGRGRRKKLKL